MMDNIIAHMPLLSTSLSLNTGQELDASIRERADELYRGDQLRQKLIRMTCTTALGEDMKRLAMMLKEDVEVTKLRPSDTLDVRP